MFWRLVGIIFICTIIVGSASAATVHHEVRAQLDRDDSIEVAILTKNILGVSDISDQKKSKLTPYFTGRITKRQLERLERDPNILRIEANKELHVLLDETTTVINAPTAWDAGYTGEGQTVCVIDTGVDYTHPALGGCIGPDCKVVGGYDFWNDDADPMDDNGHGTHVAGIVASEDATYRGVAPDAKIAAVKACSSGGSCTEFAMVEGIEWCVDNADALNIGVISISLGDSAPWDDNCFPNGLASMTINAAHEAGFIVAIASGNEGYANGINWPACVQGATSVGATTNQDTIASFSNTANHLDLLAPGVLVYSASALWESGVDFVTKSGTSMSTPHVAGAAAVLLEAGTPATSIVSSLQEHGFNIEGWQRIDVGASLPETDVCHEGVESMPATCEGGTITQDTMNGCRTIVCDNGNTFQEILACNKPGNYKPDYFEMYKQNPQTNSIKICLGETCIDRDGFARSPDFPICTGEPPAGENATITVTKVVINDDEGTLEVEDFPLFVSGTPVTSGVQYSFAPGTYTVTEQGDVGYTASFSGDCGVNGEITLAENDVKSCIITNNDIQQGGTCYESVNDVPALCNGGGIIFDESGGCRTIVCENNEGDPITLQVLACNKDGFFEMYKQVSGEGLEICLLDTCISDNGYAKSPDFPICTAEPPVCTDNDDDNFAIEGGICGQVDCNDADETINPGAPEICNGVDDNCNGQVDEGCGGEASVTLSIAPWFPQGLNVVFKCEEEGFTASAYEWDFGDGHVQTTSQDNVWHTYASSGPYTAICTASDGNNIVSDELFVELF